MGVLSFLGQTTQEVSPEDIDSIINELNSQTTVTTTTDAAAVGGAFLFMFFIWLIIFVIMVIAFWKVFEKAGQEGWKAIIPIYNMYILIKIAGRPGWWLLLFFIPFVNIVVQIIISLDIAKAFGKSELFGIFGLWLFSIVGYLILGFGDAKYNLKTSDAWSDSNNDGAKPAES